MPDEPTTPPPPAEGPPQPQFQVQIPEPHFEVLYSDQAFVSFNPMGFVIDFGQHTAPMNLTRIISRIGMSPVHMKLLTQVLGQNIAAYEERFGPIVLHPRIEAEHSRIGFQAPVEPAP